MKDSIENELFQKIHTYAISNTQAINLSLIHTMTPTVKNKDIEINFSYKSLDKTPEPPSLSPACLEKQRGLIRSDYFAIWNHV